MQTIHIRVDEKVYENLMWFLNKFTSEELQVIEEDESFIADKKYLQTELEKLEKNESKFIETKQLKESLEETIRKYEA